MVCLKPWLFAEVGRSAKIILKRHSTVHLEKKNFQGQIEIKALDGISTAPTIRLKTFMEILNLGKVGSEDRRNAVVN